MFKDVHINQDFRSALAVRVSAAARPRWFMRPLVIAPTAFAFSLLAFVVVKNSSVPAHVATTVDNTEISWNIDHGGNNLDDPTTLAEEQQLLSMVQN